MAVCCNGVLTFLCIFASLSRLMTANCSRVTSFVTNMLKSNRELLSHFNSAPSIISKLSLSWKLLPALCEVLLESSYRSPLENCFLLLETSTQKSRLQSEEKRKFLLFSSLLEREQGKN